MTYTTVDPGKTHVCGLPSKRGFAEHAHIRCDECGKDWWMLFTYADDVWVEWDPT